MNKFDNGNKENQESPSFSSSFFRLLSIVIDLLFAVFDVGCWSHLFSHFDTCKGVHGDKSTFITEVVFKTGNSHHEVGKQVKYQYIHTLL